MPKSNGLLQLKILPGKMISYLIITSTSTMLTIVIEKLTHDVELDPLHNGGRLVVACYTLQMQVLMMMMLVMMMMVLVMMPTW